MTSDTRRQRLSHRHGLASHCDSPAAARAIAPLGGADERGREEGAEQGRLGEGVRRLVRPCSLNERSLSLQVKVEAGGQKRNQGGQRGAGLKGERGRGEGDEGGEGGSAAEEREGEVTRECSAGSGSDWLERLVQMDQTQQQQQQRRQRGSGNDGRAPAWRKASEKREESTKNACKRVAE